MAPSPGVDVVLAHGVSSRQDLPLPLGYTLTAALLALAVSFGVLALRWRTSRFRGAASGRPVRANLAEFADSPELRWGLRLLGLVLTSYAGWAALAGPDLATNPTAGLVYVLFWVGLVPVSLLFGPVWKLLNPLRTVHLGICAALRLDPDDPPFALPRRVGYWPAAAGLASFVWLELCAPNRDSTGTITTYFSLYAGMNLLGAMAFGRRWFTRCDGFEVFSSLIARMSVLGRRDDGALVLRNPLENVDAVLLAPGLAPVLGVMLGSTAFDALTSTSWWSEVAYDSDLSPSNLAALGLSVTILVVITAFSLASWLAGLVSGQSPAGLATAFAPSLVPIATGYLIAHYFSLFVFAGQQTISRASDPMVDGSNLFGTADWTVNYGILSVTGIATVQVVSIVTGHVLGVLSAHDRAVRLFAAKGAVIGQLPMMVLMIGYTLSGLSLLFAG